MPNAWAFPKMPNPPTIADFESFASALRQTGLPGTEDRRFLEDIHKLASRCIYLKTEAQQSVKATALKYEPTVRVWRKVLGMLKRAQKSLIDARGLCEKKYPDSSYWKELFHTAEESLSDLLSTIQATQQLALVQLHPRSLRKHERSKWQPLLRRPEHDYPLDRLGFRQAETWFLDSLDRLFSRYFNQKKVARIRLTQAIYKAAFDEDKGLETIKVAMARVKRRRDQAQVK